MALLTFPNAPVNGQLYPVTPVIGQNQYRYDSATSTWVLEGAATAVIPGCYGDGANVASICVDAQGRLTSAVNVPTNAPRIVAPPTTQSDPGVAGDISYDANWFYYHDGTEWQRVFKDWATW